MFACQTRNGRMPVTALLVALASLCPVRLFADVVTIGAVTPVPPSGGGTSTAQLIVGDGTDDTSNNIWGWVSVGNGTLLQYGSLIVADNENFFGEVNVTSNYLNGVISQLNFSGQGSTSNPTVQVGNEGNGSLNLSGGSRMTLTNQNADMAIGLDVTGVGYTNVTDQFTLLTVPRNLIVGQSGYGSLNVLNRANVRTTSNSRTNYVSIGRNASGVGNAVVDGQGSILQVGSGLKVGESGQGALTISHGGMVNVIDGTTPLIGTPPPYVSIGTNPTGVGSVIVEDTGSRLLVRRDLQIGVLGQGSLAIRDNGLVQILDNPLALPTILVGPYGRIDLHGGTLAGSTPDPAATPASFGTIVDGYLGGSGLVRGTAEFTENSFLEANPGDSLRFEGAVSNQGSVTVRGGEVQFNKVFTNNAAAGPIAPGRISLENGGTVRFREPLTNNGVLSSALGATNIHGQIDNPGNIVVARDTVATFYDAVNNTGTLTVKPGGNALFLTDLSFIGLSIVQLGIGPSDLDDNSSQITASGTIALGGTLEISLEGGYDQLIGQPLQLISAGGGITGEFDSIQTPLVPNDIEIGFLYSSTGVSMEVKAVNNTIELPGDYNNDGSVDAADYSVWRNNLGSLNSLPNDDTPGVDQEDYARWKTHFGEIRLFGAGSTAFNSPATPEPSAALLLISAFATLVVIRRR